MIELKPCPFCGYEYPTITMGFSGIWKVNCPWCQSSFSLDGTCGRNLSRELTAKAWNRRGEDGKT